MLWKIGELPEQDESDMDFFVAARYGSKTVRKHYVYVLVDPITNLRMYAGQTASPVCRAAQHADPEYSTSRAMREWKARLAASGGRPIFKIVQRCTEFTVDSVESIWIRKLWAENPLCVNRQDNPLGAPAPDEVEKSEDDIQYEEKRRILASAYRPTKRSGKKWVSAFANRKYPSFDPK